MSGIPLFYLELAIGQRMRKAAISCWNLVSPLAAGIGLASAAVSFIIGLYYNTMVAWTLLYLWGSATSPRPLPFTVCPVYSKSTSNYTRSQTETISSSSSISNSNKGSSANNSDEIECQVGRKLHLIFQIYLTRTCETFLFLRPR